MNITMPPTIIVYNLYSNSSVVGKSVESSGVSPLKSYNVLNIINPPIIAMIAPITLHTTDNIGSFYFEPISMILEDIKVMERVKTNPPFFFNKKYQTANHCGYLN
jgi:hypothetical protein